MAKSTSKLFQSEEPKEMKEDALNFPEKVEEKLTKETIPAEDTEVIDTPDSTADDIVDIDLSATRKKRFRINGDNNRILELNTSDMNISSRLTSAYKRLTAYNDEVSKKISNIDVDALTEEEQELIENELTDIDEKMKKEIDYIFDAPVSEVCSDGGSMYDPFDGMFRFEHIIEAITKLYENNLDKEFAKMRKRINIKTSKYTKKYHN